MGELLDAILPIDEGLAIAVYSTPAVGLLAVLRDVAPEQLLRAILQANRDPAALRQTFQFPGGDKLTYELATAKDKWVMISRGAQTFNRDFDRWPLIDGRFH